ncbi:MAG: DUF4190 domain-containing protein [Pseudonocardiales bacterium]
MPPTGAPNRNQPGARLRAWGEARLGIVWLWWIGSILALIFGYTARKQIRERGQSGDGLAIAGIVLGWVGVGFLALFLIFGIFGMVGLFDGPDVPRFGDRF